MMTSIEADEEMGAGIDAARENGTGLRLAVGIGAGIETETSVADGKAPKLEAAERALPTRQHHGTGPTILVSVAQRQRASLPPKMLKYVHLRGPLVREMLTISCRPLSPHKPKPRVINRRNDLLNLRLGKRGLLPRSRRQKRVMPQAHGSSLLKWMAGQVALRLP